MPGKAYLVSIATLRDVDRASIVRRCQLRQSILLILLDFALLPLWSHSAGTARICALIADSTAGRNEDRVASWQCNSDQQASSDHVPVNHDRPCVT